ncbi:MAG: protoporphyrinogen oxidase [Actinomycetota bacterium]
MPRHVVVIGGGITGLSAAYELKHSGFDGLITMLEADDILGGKIRSVDIHGRAIDLGPDGFLSRREETFTLLAELGRTADLRDVGASGASIVARGKLRALPGHLVMGLPTQWRALARSGVLSWRGLVRAGLDRLLPWPASRGPIDDLAIGPFIGRKLGREVVRTLIDPMVGGIHAGRVEELSARATFPQLLDAAKHAGSLMAAMRPKPVATTTPSSAPSGPGRAGIFASLDASVASLPRALEDYLREQGVQIKCLRSATGLHRSGSSWTVSTSEENLEADGVIITTPAGAASLLLADLAPNAARLLADIPYASVATITLSFDPRAVTLPSSGTGILIPSASHLDGIDGPLLATAVTFLSRKWPHLATEGELLIRASVGKIDDDSFAKLSDEELGVRIAQELGLLLKAEKRGEVLNVTRWMHALPQHRVHHLRRVAAIEAELDRLGGLSIAGAALHGVGIGACIGQGRAAAQNILAGLEAKS